MIYVNFISTTYLKDNSPIIANVSDDELVPFIKIAQDTGLQRALGTNLMKDLQNKVANSSLNADEVILLEEYIQPCVVWLVTQEWTLFSHYKYTNKGITKQTSDNSASADFKEVNFLRDDVRNKGEYFKERLTRYLLANQPLFPMYWGGTVDVSTILPKYNNYYSGIYTGRRNLSRYRSGYCQDCGPSEVNENTWINLNP